MSIMHSIVRLLTATMVVGASSVCTAQTDMATTDASQTTRLRGTIDSVDSTGLTFKARDGATTRLALLPGATVIDVVKASMADIKPGSFLGSAAVPQPDGTLRATEVHLFPESMRGAGEGHRPYAPIEKGTMTNGASAAVPVTGIDGSTLTVDYKGGSKQIVVPADTPIVRYEVGSMGDLKTGARFTVTAATARADGSYEAGRINVGKDGVVPQ
jgi:hypothetical protein